jgi:3-oxoacyl-[acyl-carrier-protein] synthase-3
MASATREAVEEAGLQLEDIQLIIPHQANKRIIESAARGLRMPMDRFMLNVNRYGNTSTASIPLAFFEAMDDGRIHDGDHLVLVGFGAGLTWGALAMQWIEPVEKPTRRIQRRRRWIRWYSRIRSFIRRVLRKIEGLIWGTKSYSRKD